MSSAFDTEFAADALPDLLSEFGESITYRTSVGADSTVTAVVWRADQVVERRNRHAVAVLRVRVKAASSDLPFLERGAAVHVGEKWHDFTRVESEGGGSVSAWFEHVSILETTTSQGDI